MALTITSVGSGVSTTSNGSVATGATITAAIGDMLVAIVAADNAGTNGASSISSITDSAGNTWTQRALINFDPGAASDGATLGIFTTTVSVTLSSGTVTANLSPNTASKAIQVYKAVPGVGELVQFVATDATGSTGNATAHSAATVSVTNGDTIFGCAAVETRQAASTGDADTTNGSWSTVLLRDADTFLDATSMRCASQFKTVNATGNQSWTYTTISLYDSARSYLIIGPAAVPAGGARSYGYILG